ISYAARVVRSFGCCARMAASARRSSARRSSNDIAKGSFATAERHVAVTGFTGASRAASRLVSADARATSTARAATRSASAAGAALCTDAIVRRLRRDPDVVRMRLAEARAGDANEPCLRAELIDRRRADVLHSGAQAAHQLVDERTKRPLRIHVTLDSFG